MVWCGDSKAWRCVLGLGLVVLLWRGFSWSGDVDIQATEARGSIFIQLATEGASSAVQAIPNRCEQNQQCHG